MEVPWKRTASDRGHKDKVLASTDLTMETDNTYAYRYLGNVVINSQKREWLTRTGLIAPRSTQWFG